MTPRQRAMLYDMEMGPCPRCGRERGWSEDFCEEERCPEWWDIERRIWPPEMLSWDNAQRLLAELEEERSR